MATARYSNSYQRKGTITDGQRMRANECMCGGGKGGGGRAYNEECGVTINLESFIYGNTLYSYKKQTVQTSWQVMTAGEYKL